MFAGTTRHPILPLAQCSTQRQRIGPRRDTHLEPFLISRTNYAIFRFIFMRTATTIDDESTTTQHHHHNTTTNTSTCSDDNHHLYCLIDMSKSVFLLHSTTMNDDEWGRPLHIKNPRDVIRRTTGFLLVCSFFLSFFTLLMTIYE